MGKQEPAENTDAAKKKGTNHNAIIALILILVGLGVLLYPVVATQWNNYNQSRAAEEYAKLEELAPPEVLHTAWEEAQAYNAGLGQISIGDAWTTTDNEDRHSGGR